MHGFRDLKFKISNFRFKIVLLVIGPGGQTGPIVHTNLKSEILNLKYASLLPTLLAAASSSAHFAKCFPIAQRSRQLQPDQPLE